MNNKEFSQAMPVLKARTRVIYFRVSEDEFNDFLKMCHAAGSRSLSDLARSALQRMLTEREESQILLDRLKTFDELMFRVNEKLTEMTELVRISTRNKRASGIDYTERRIGEQ